MKRFPGLKPDFDIKNVQIALGYPRYYVVEEPIRTLIEEMLEISYSLITPEGVYEVFPCHVSDEKVKIGGTFNHIIKSNKLAKHLRESTEVVVFAVTIGEGLEEEVRKLFHIGEFTRASVLDAIGSALAEGLAEAADRYIQEESAREGYEITQRYSPGYGDWKLNDQKRILGVIGGDSIGISLTSAMIMVPRKSITAIIGRRKVSEKGK